MLELVYISFKKLTLDTMGDKFFCYNADWDSIFLRDTKQYYKVFRDGSKVSIGAESNMQLGFANRVGGRHCGIINNPDTNTFIFVACDSITGQFHIQEVLNPTWEPPYGYFTTGDYIDDKHDYCVTSTESAGDSVIKVQRLTTGDLLGTITISGNNFRYDNLSYAGRGKVLAIHFATGKVAMLDYLGRQVLWTSGIDPCRLAVYDCLHDIILALGTDNTMRVYSLDVKPTALSAPEFIYAHEHQHRLTGSRVVTKLIGSLSEPCPGWVVNWELVGTAYGALLKRQSLTGLDGYAENFYFGPEAPIELVGDDEIQVSVGT